MPINEGLQKLAPGEAPSDPNVRIPDHVTAASAAADAIHEQYYPKLEAAPAAPAKEALPQPPQPEPLHTPPAAHADQPTPPAQQQADPAPKPEDANLSAEEWRHRFLSMQGRFNSEVRKNGAMEQQMVDLGQELIRTQNMIAQGAPAAPRQAPSGQGNENLITEADREAYGDELIDLAQRAAKSAVTPELLALRADNQRLTQRVQTTGKRELFATLDGRVPEWRKINVDPRFITWLRLPNIYTGRLRQDMLNEAVAGADAPKAIALFKDFLSEAYATGQQAPAAHQEPQAPLVPREPALALEALAAPGRARPASGDTQVPADKPIHTRADIAKFYDNKRRGLYAGRDAEVAAFEADLTAAQREGRIRG